VTRPGDPLRAFAARWCCTGTMTRIVDPLIADLQHEHSRAVQEGHVWRSRAIRMAGWMAFIRVLVICAWRDELAPRNWTAAERQAVVRTITASILLVIAITVLFEIPPLEKSGVWWAPPGLRGRLLLTLIPQALAITITLGVTLGIVLALGGRAFSRRVAEGVVFLAVVASALSFVNVGWVVPAANQAFRVASAGRSDLPKGAPELSLGELRQAIESGDRAPLRPPAWFFGDSSRYLQDIKLQYHLRWAMSFSPMVFALLILSIAAGGFPRRWVLGVATVSATLGYYLLLFVGRPSVFAGAMPAYVSAWAPNVTFGLITTFLTLRKLRSSVGDEPAW
jgi:lipopolysaccharide export system permease LptF/LptG-like protein